MRTNSIAAILVLIVSARLIAFQNTNVTVEQATSAYQSGDAAGAERILKAVLAEQPRDLHALVLMGVVLDTETRYGEAEPYYKQALGIAPGSAQVLNDVANHYLASGSATKAQEFYEKVVAIEPHHTNAILQLAQISVDNNQGQRALSYLDQLPASAASESGTTVLKARALALCGRCKQAREAIDSVEKNPAGLQSFFSLGMASVQCKLYEEAKKSFSRALDADPNNFDVLYNLGLASLRSGDVRGAQTAFERALAVRPRDADTTRALAQTRVRLAFLDYHQQGEGAALRELDKTPEADRTSDDYVLRAELLDAEGKVTEAAAAINQALRVAPGNVTLYYEAVDFLLKHKLFKETEMFLEEALRIRPDDRDLLLAKALTLNLLRRNPDSESLLEQIQTKWPEWDRVYLLKGMLLEIALKPEEARRTLEKAIALGANTPEAYYYEAMAMMDAATPDLNAAQRAISRALTVGSDDPYIYLLAGKIAVARRDYATGIQQLLTATRLDPSLVPAHYALRHAYTAQGDQQKAELEMQTIKRIAKDTQGTDESRYAVENFLFAVRPPG